MARRRTPGSAPAQLPCPRGGGPRPPPSRTRCSRTRRRAAAACSSSGPTCRWQTRNDDNFHRLSIQFAYHRYESITESTVDIGEAVGGLIQGGGAALLRAF